MGAFSTDEIMTIAASRELTGARSCFVGIGLPSIAANLARSLHAPGLVLVYESGTVGAKPTRLPLSIGDGELASTADVVVSVPEIFNYWLQPGRIDVGMLGAAQVDRFANLNTTVIGPYDRPKVRLPGAGGAPEIAASCPRSIIVMRQSKRTFVDELDYLTSVGFGDGAGARSRLGMPGAGPLVLISDLGIYRPDPETFEMTLTAVHPGATVAEVRHVTGWDLAVSDDLVETPEPSEEELALLRRLHAGSSAKATD
jgi:glutaconate CoA-transferase subunit B